MNCPRCNKEMEKVLQPFTSLLNAEQFDAIKCGDYYCDDCRRYYWVALVPSTKESTHSMRPKASHVQEETK